MKTILISGGAGFIGSHVVRLFVKKYKDYQIINLDKLTYAGNLENLRDIEKEPNYKFIKGDIVVFQYPFSDFTSNKRRPALVLAMPGGNDIIVCQITSQIHSDNYSIILDNEDFSIGSLNQISYIRPNKIISVDKKIIIYKAGSIKIKKLNQAIDKVIEIISK